MKTAFLSDEQLAVDSCWERENHSLFRIQALICFPHSSDVLILMHICLTLTRFMGNKIEVGRGVRR